MINVLHLIDQYHIGGPGKTIINTAKYIDGSRFKVTVATFLPDNRETELSNKIRESGIDLLELRDTRGISPGNLRALLNFIDKKKILIVHSHGYKADIYTLLVRLLRFANIVALTTHHGWIRNKLGQIILGNITLKGSFFFDHTIIVSEEMEKYLSKAVLKNKKYSVLHNAIVTDDYKEEGLRQIVRQKLKIADDEILLLSVGRLSPEKGCRNLVDAFSEVTKKRQNVKLVFVGDGPLMNSLVQYVRERKLREHIKLVGHFNRVQPFYEAADIFICPSDTEGLSNSILEAMAYSLPVVATDVGGNPEIISNNQNGLLVAAKNSIELSKAVLGLIEAPSKRDMLGANGYKTIEAKFSFKERTMNLQEIYLRAVRNKQKLVLK